MPLGKKARELHSFVAQLPGTSVVLGFLQTPKLHRKITEKFAALSSGHSPFTTPLLAHYFMNYAYGIESSGKHPHTPHRKPARYLVIIDSAGSTIARLFLDTREQVAEIDAATEEIALMTKGLTPTRTAHLPEWDRALEGHNPSERAAAEVYTLDI